MEVQQTAGTFSESAHLALGQPAGPAVACAHLLLHAGPVAHNQTLGGRRLRDQRQPSAQQQEGGMRSHPRLSMKAGC